MTLEEMVKDQLKEEFESVVGEPIPEDDSDLQITMGSRRFKTLDEFTYYMANRMWDTFDEELTSTDVEVK
ncbi:MAG: hypothetical protein NZ824_11145 [Candidatus Thioglobus sp.]|nr:hypothetical protein [Candidatus Thioglobus sp.]